MIIEFNINFAQVLLTCVYAIFQTIELNSLTFLQQWMTYFDLRGELNKKNSEKFANYFLNKRYNWKQLFFLLNFKL